MDQQSPRDDTWRQKYYDSLDALDRQEQEWRSVEALLRQALLQLATFAALAEPALAGRIDALRAELRRGTESAALAQLLKDVARGLEQDCRDAINGVQARSTALAREALAAIAERLFEDPSCEEARSVRAALDEGVDGVRRAARRLADIIGERLQSVGTGGNAILLRLLEHLAIPAEFAPRLETLKSALREPLSQARLADMVRELAEVIADMRIGVLHEKRELETFLLQLSENLQSLDGDLKAAAAIQSESFDEGRKLGSAMDAHMRGIEVSMESARALDDLKSRLLVHVQTIREQMVSFRRAEDARADEVERDMAALTDRLALLESEAEELRERVRSERRQALIDPLTGIPNRLAYDERIQHEYQRWRRYGAPLVLSIWDVDHFKRINDNYGHQAGDKVLRVIATLLKSQTRATDFTCRYGGEEFVILLPETDLVQAAACAEKIRLAIESAEFHHHHERVKVTVSCGMAQFSGNDTVSDVFNRADRALYAAKEAGRNCCKAEPVATG
ncbi:MAG: diguanylate cyclase [Thiohalomonadaceae bacterium]